MADTPGMAAEQRPPSLALWAAVLGVTGFVAGFLGPMTFNPEANQGPMLGIFITGPGALIFGFALGVALRLIRLPAYLQWKVLFGCTAALALGTLYFCMPEPAVRGHAIAARVRACQPASQAIDAAIEDWRGRIAKVTWAQPRADWEEEARRMPQQDAGVVLRLQVTRRNTLFEHQKLWDKGRLSTSGWKDVSEEQSYFSREAGGDCSAYTRGISTVYFPQGKGSGDWPPRDLPNFLGYQVLGPVPVEYANLMKQ